MSQILILFEAAQNHALNKELKPLVKGKFILNCYQVSGNPDQFFTQLPHAFCLIRIACLR